MEGIEFFMRREPAGVRTISKKSRPFLAADTFCQTLFFQIINDRGHLPEAFNILSARSFWLFWIQFKQFGHPFLGDHKYLAGIWIIVSDRNSIRSALFTSIPKRAPVSLIKFLSETNIR